MKFVQRQEAIVQRATAGRKREEAARRRDEVGFYPEICFGFWPENQFGFYFEKLFSFYPENFAVFALRHLTKVRVKTRGIIVQERETVFFAETCGF